MEAERVVYALAFASAWDRMVGQRPMVERMMTADRMKMADW